MTCAEFEILLCDHVDGTLDSAVAPAFEQHRRECAACAEYARDVTGAVAFIGRAEDVSPPLELLTKLTFEIPTGGAVRKGIRAWMAGWLQPIRQPRFAMGMAMTILSFSMLGRFAGIELRQLKPSDLQPANIWAAVDDRVHRTWERAVKYYENLRLVYEVQARLQEWTTQEDQERKGRPVEEPNSQSEQQQEGKGTK